MSEEQIIVQLNPDTPPTGTDLSIVNAARKSFGRRSEWANVEDMWINPFVGEVRVEMLDPSVTPVLKDKDKRLLEFLARGMTAGDFDRFLYRCSSEGKNLWENWDDHEKKFLTEKLWQWRNTPTHDTPFNHGFFSFEVKAPIFVARHLVKHEYLIMSEYSRRYITDDVEFYIPKVWRKAAEDVKQGSSSEEVKNTDYGEAISDEMEAFNTNCIEFYNQLLLAKVAPEQARMVLPQSLMTAWTWSGTLGAFANMCKLRLSPDTQYETRLVAQQVYTELKKQFPVAAPLIVGGVL